MGACSGKPDGTLRECSADALTETVTYQLEDSPLKIRQEPGPATGHFRRNSVSLRPQSADLSADSHCHAEAHTLWGCLMHPPELPAARECPTTDEKNADASKSREVKKPLVLSAKLKTARMKAKAKKAATDDHSPILDSPNTSGSTIYVSGDTVASNHSSADTSPKEERRQPVVDTQTKDGKDGMNALAGRRSGSQLGLCEPDDDSGDDSEESEGELFPDYQDPNFWKEVYTGVRSSKNVPTEWVLNYEHFKAQQWHKYLVGGNILELGCGDSSLMSDAYDDGYADDITSTDIDHSVVEIMKQENADRPGIKYVQADACNMKKFSDKSFEIVFDKSLMDALICGGRGAIRRASAEIHRVLKDSGIYICVSLSYPEQMKKAIEDTGKHHDRLWRVQVLSCESEHQDEEQDEPTLVYMYVCRKVHVHGAMVR